MAVSMDACMSLVLEAGRRIVAEIGAQVKVLEVLEC
jgi:hypothetical protein